MSELRFSLAERKPDGIKSTGDSGTTITLSDPNAKSILDEIHNATTENHTSVTDWVLLTYSGSDLKSLKVLGSGKNGISELKQAGLRDDIVAYGLIRVLDTVDNIPTLRFVYLTWIGENVSGITNARIGVNKTAVREIIGHYSIEYYASKLDEINEDDIMAKVQDASGSRVRVLEPKKTTTTNVSSKSSGTYSIVPKEKGGILSVQDESGVKDLIKKVRHGEGGLNWLTLGYATREALHVTGSGSGGIEEFRENLKDNEVAYGFLAVSSTVDQTEMRRFIYVRWVPENTPPLLKGKLTTHRGFIEDFYNPFHITINASDLNEITSSVIQDKISHMTFK